MKKYMTSLKMKLIHLLKKIEDGDCHAEDGCWYCPRNGTAHTTTILNLNQNKVVGYCEVEKNKGSYCGNFNGVSNMMESYGVKKTLDDMAPYLQNKKILTFMTTTIKLVGLLAK